MERLHRPNRVIIFVFSGFYLNNYLYKSIDNYVVGKLNEEYLENVSGGGNKMKQFGQGFASGLFGPAWAYGHAGTTTYTEPQTKGQKAARYAGIATGVAGAVGTVGMSWVSGGIAEIIDSGIRKS
ncbi:MAG: hypothetical protein Q4D57_02710 [Clostridia bacterium]|nr:hypothetical protein [Clostridia bacterium]